MADYSYVTIDVASDQAEALAEIVTEVQNRTVPITAEDLFDHGGEVSFEIEQARYGFDGDEEAQAIVEALTARGIAWTAKDDGGYEWPEQEYAWNPELGRVATRILDGTGSAVLTAGQYAWLRQEMIPESAPYSEVLDGRYPAAFLTALDLHFGDDPAGWVDMEVGS